MLNYLKRAFVCLLELEHANISGRCNRLAKELMNELSVILNAGFDSITEEEANSFISDELEIIKRDMNNVEHNLLKNNINIDSQTRYYIICLLRLKYYFILAFENIPKDNCDKLIQENCTQGLQLLLKVVNTFLEEEESAPVITEALTTKSDDTPPVFERPANTTIQFYIKKCCARTELLKTSKYKPSIDVNEWDKFICTYIDEWNKFVNIYGFIDYQDIIEQELTESQQETEEFKTIALELGVDCNSELCECFANIKSAASYVITIDEAFALSDEAREIITHLKEILLNGIIRYTPLKFREVLFPDENDRDYLFGVK